MNPSNPIFSQVPKTMSDLRGWVRCVSEIREYLQLLAVDRDPPGLVTGFTVSSTSTGFKLLWNAVPKASVYHVFRNISNDPNTATVIAILPGHTNVSYFDPKGQLTDNPLYYWVRAFNVANVPGPFSPMQSIANP